MFIGKKHNIDCVFKRTDGEKVKCTFPKTIKMCYGCSCYLKNDGDIDKTTKYISLVVSKNNSRMALAISFVALLLSFITLLFKFIEMIPKK